MEIEQIILLAILAVIVLQLIMMALIVDVKKRGKKTENVVRIRKKELNETGKVVIPCNRCGLKLRVSYDERTYLCPICNYKFRLRKKEK